MNDLHNKLHYLADEARRTKKTCTTILPSIYGNSITRWTATPTVMKDGIAIDISFENLNELIKSKI